MTEVAGAMPPEWFIEYARKQACNSPCQSKRGVAIWDAHYDDLVALGFNRPPPPILCDGSDTCRATCSQRAVHAEQVAMLGVPSSELRGCSMLHVKVVNTVIVPSGPPSCVECSKLALNVGIAFFWLMNADGWKRYEMLDFHQRSIANSKHG